MYSYDMRGTYGNARRTLRVAPRDLASLRIEHEVKIEALKVAWILSERVNVSARHAAPCIANYQRDNPGVIL